MDEKHTLNCITDSDLLTFSFAVLLFRPPLSHSTHSNRCLPQGSVIFKPRNQSSLKTPKLDSVIVKALHAQWDTDMVETGFKRVDALFVCMLVGRRSSVELV